MAYSLFAPANTSIQLIAVLAVLSARARRGRYIQRMWIRWSNWLQSVVICPRRPSMPVHEGTRARGRASHEFVSLTTSELEPL